jgi:hypothetical protein
MKSQNNKIALKRYIQLIAVSILPVFAVYLPFVIGVRSLWGIPLGDNKLLTIFANWDGPNYVYNAITGYLPETISQTPFLKSAGYYPAHFPTYSWLIKIFSFVFGYYWASFVLQILTGLVLNIIFYEFVKSKSKHPIWLTLVFTTFPARYLVVRSVIGPELLLSACVLCSLMMWERKHYTSSALFTMFGVMLKFQALVLPLTYGAIALFEIIRLRKITITKFLPPILGICGSVIVFAFYYYTIGNFFAYFDAQKIAGLNASLPFGMFNYSSKWVGTGWMETALIYFVALFILSARLIHQKQITLFTFVASYTAMLSLIPQVDIMRLAMPLAPIFIYTFHEFFETKYVRYALVLTMPVVYLFAINFIVTNTAPITDWSIFR